VYHLVILIPQLDQVHALGKVADVVRLLGSVFEFPDLPAHHIDYADARNTLAVTDFKLISYGVGKDTKVFYRMLRGQTEGEKKEDAREKYVLHD
jgi:hypothetical protein